MADERFSLKDHLFNLEKVTYLGDLLSRGIPGFRSEDFVGAVMAEMPDLELKQRIAQIARVLTEHLHEKFDEAAAQILASLPPPLDPTLTDGDFGDFIIAPFGKYVEDHGLDHYETSIPLLHDLTMRFSMEGSLRPFINKHSMRTLDTLDEWAEDDHYHVRRLVSEGTRPLLPWAPRINLDLTAPIPLLDKLHADPTRYVTRSVANHLNDISKLDPTLTIETLRRWHSSGLQSQSELSWMTRHALRTLIKKGSAAAMDLLGYRSDPELEVGPIDLKTPIVHAGGALEFSVNVTTREDLPLLVDYTIDFVKKNGTLGPKAFKLKTVSATAHKSITVRKRHPLRSDATTYSLYPGTHRLTVVINGTPAVSTEFEVVTIQG